MAKSPDAFRTISEVSAVLETPPHVLRFWETKFPQIRPVKRAGGRRYYRPGDVALLGGIKVLLHEQGMTIRGVQKLLKERGAKQIAALSPLPWEEEETAGDDAVALTEVDETRTDSAGQAVIVGPWPGIAGQSSDLEPDGGDERPAPTLLDEFLSGTLSRLARQAPTGGAGRAEPPAGRPAARADRDSRPASDGPAADGPASGDPAPDRVIPVIPESAALAAAEADRPAPTLADLRAALAAADRDRLRAAAPRLRPLVARLAALAARGTEAVEAPLRPPPQSL